MRVLIVLVLLAVFASACGGEAPNPSGGDAGLSLRCGAGTVEQDGECVPADTLACGVGTERQGDQCVPSPDSCGAGLVIEDGVCRQPTQAADMSAFLANTSLVESSRAEVYQGSYDTLSHHIRYLWPELSERDASAWAVGESVMIGSGLALHFMPGELTSDDTSAANPSVTWSINLSDATGPDGRCLSTLQPKADSTKHHLALFRWNGGQATPVVCARTGSVPFEYDDIRTRMTVNALFGDGTAFTRTVIAPRTN